MKNSTMVLFLIFSSPPKYSKLKNLAAMWSCIRRFQVLTAPREYDKGEGGPHAAWAGYLLSDASQGPGPYRKEPAMVG